MKDLHSDSVHGNAKQINWIITCLVLDPAQRTHTGLVNAWLMQHHYEGADTSAVAQTKRSFLE